MGTHLRALSESYPMNTNMTRFGRFSKFFASLCKSSLSIGRVKGFASRMPRRDGEFNGGPGGQVLNAPNEEN